MMIKMISIAVLAALALVNPSVATSGSGLDISGLGETTTAAPTDPSTAAAKDQIDTEAETQVAETTTTPEPTVDADSYGTVEIASKILCSTFSALTAVEQNLFLTALRQETEDAFASSNLNAATVAAEAKGCSRRRAGTVTFVVYLAADASPADVAEAVAAVQKAFDDGEFSVTVNGVTLDLDNFDSTASGTDVFIPTPESKVQNDCLNCCASAKKAKKDKKAKASKAAKEGRAANATSEAKMTTKGPKTKKAKKNKYSTTAAATSTAAPVRRLRRDTKAPKAAKATKATKATKAKKAKYTTVATAAAKTYDCAAVDCNTLTCPQSSAKKDKKAKKAKKGAFARMMTSPASVAGSVVGLAGVIGVAVGTALMAHRRKQRYAAIAEQLVPEATESAPLIGGEGHSV